MSEFSRGNFFPIPDSDDEHHGEEEQLRPKSHSLVGNIYPTSTRFLIARIQNTIKKCGQSLKKKMKVRKEGMCLCVKKLVNKLSKAWHTPLLFEDSFCYSTSLLDHNFLIISPHMKFVYSVGKLL